MKARLQGNVPEVVMLLVGQLGALAAYGFFLGVIALGTGPSAPLPIILVCGLPIAAGVVLNHAAPEGSLRALIGAWSVLLGPLMAAWIFASVRPNFGDASAATTAIDVLLIMVLLASVFGAWGLLRTEERERHHVITAAVWGSAGLLALLTMLAGHPDVLVVAAYTVGFAAQLMTFDSLRRESGWTPARPAAS